MENERKIFDLTCIEDISNYCKKNLKLFNIRNDTKELLNLFHIKNILSVDEIIVAMYRLYKKEKSRAWVTSTIYNLSRKGIIKQKTRGQYERIKF